jgi:hypothetical protein
MTDNFDDIYGSKYFSVPDLGGGNLRVKIGKVDVADLREKDGTTRKKYVLFFNGQEKAMVLNKTNAMTLAGAFGKNRADWVNQGIELYSEMTGLGKPGLRIRALRVQKPIETELDDAVPY